MENIKYYNRLRQLALDLDTARRPYQLRTAIRNYAGSSRYYPVIVQDGNFAPHHIGKIGGWFTKGGSRISFPSGYSKKGWGNMQYICSTRQVIVGRQWLENLGINPDKI